MIVFVHIEKAAGTTLNHILRTNFPLRHYDVRPYSPESKGVFQINDLRTALSINPWISSISGHAICPAAGLEKEYPQIKYITLLRNPVKRYVSQFQYWREGMKKNITFEDFLEVDGSFNLHTKKIAGSESLEAAKEILSKKFFLVGIVEQFDMFLLMLKNKMRPHRFDPGYRKQNVAKTDSPLKKSRSNLVEQHYEQIVARNRLDMELYSFVENEILQKEIEQYGMNLQKDLAIFQEKLNSFKWRWTRYLDYFFRKLYIDPVTGLIRLQNGHPYKGSY